MAIVWEKPTITARDITRILVQQYGPENPTRILVDDDTKPISYNSALVNCECLRCGKKFSYTPSAIVNALYYNGYVCNTCGMLSDTELQDQQKEEMRVGTLKLLKENGIDVVQEAIDAEKEKKEAAEDEDYNDALHDAYNEANDTSKSVESSKPVVEEKHEEVKETPVEKVNEEVVKPVEKKVEKKPEVKKEVKQEPVKETKVEEPKPVEKKNDYMVSDEDYNGSIGDQVKDEVEIVEEDEIPDDTGDDITEDDVFGVEEPEESDEVEEVAKAFNKQPEKSEESVQTEVIEPEVKEVQPEEKAEDNGPDYVWIGTDAYTEDELQKVLKNKMDNIVKKIHFNPYDPDTFEINDNAELSVKCRTCGQTIVTDKVDTLDTVESLSDVCKKYGKELPEGKNNYHNIEPMLYSCPVCTSEILTKGFNSYHKKLVDEICKKANINILDKHHLYINDPNEELRVECNGVIKILKFSLILSKFGRGQDARKDPMFENKDQTKKIKVETKEVSTESVKPEVEEKPVVKQPVVTNLDTENKIKVVQERVNFTENVTDVPNESKPVVREKEPEEPKVVLRPKATEVPKQDPVKGPEKVTLHAKAPEPTEEQKAKLNQFDSHHTEQKKPVFSMKEGTANNNSAYGSMFNSGRVKDSNADLEEERAYNERQLNKHKIFSESASLKTAKKNIAKLTGTENPFEREISLKQEFEETVFADFIKELSNKTGVDYKLILDERSYEIPVVDFENGTRIICSNLDEPGLANVKYEWLNRVPFSWKEDVAEDDGTGRLRRKPKSFRWVVLFSDSIEFAKDATFSALIKYINPSVLAYDGKKIVLQDNLIIQYTKNQQYLRDFDKRNSTFPSKKPATGSIGIIARWNSTSKATARDVLKLRMQMEGHNTNVNNLDTLASDYSEYMAASIKYVEHMNPETNRVIYTITEYVEVGSSIIADGFAQCVRALLKEYFKKYPQLIGVTPYIIVEIDPNTFPSPALQSYIDRGTLCKMDNSYKLIVEGSKANLNAVDKSLRYSYIRRPEYRQGSNLDRMRQDRRMFNAGTLIVRMSNEIKQAGLSNTIRNPEVRKAFIENMGYIEATQAEIKQYFVNQSIIAAMMSDGYTARLTERIDENMFNSSKMVSDSNSGYGMNNVLMNPAMMMKYNSIMQNGSPEAKDYFMRMMREDYQQKMQDYMMQHQGTQGQVFSQNPQQRNMFNPMMGMNNFGMGMNPMMNGFGMGMHQ